MSMLDRMLRYRPVLLGASMLAFGWAWYDRAQVEVRSAIPDVLNGSLASNRSLMLAVLPCYFIGFVLLLLTWRPRVLWEKGPQRPRNLLRAVVALVPLIGFAFLPEVPRLSPTEGGSRAWYEREGRYFVEYNPGTPLAQRREIPKTEYDEIERRGAMMISTIIFIFGYAAVSLAWITLVWPPAARRAPAS